MALRTLFACNSVAAAISSIIFNVLFIYVASTIRSEVLSAFRRFQTFSSIVDLVFALCAVVAQMHFVVEHGSMVIVSLGPLSNVYPEAALYFLAVNDSFYILIVLLMPVSFFYRYVLLCQGRLFSTKHICICAILVFAFWSAYVLPIFVCLHNTNSNPEFYATLSGHVRATLPELDSKFVIIGGYMRNADLVAVVLSGVIAFCGAYTIIAVCIYKIIRYIKLNQTTFSTRNLVIQNQVTKALIAQALAPFIFYITPLSILASCGLLQLNCGPFCPVLTCLLDWIPVCNAVLSLFVVVPYRRQLVKLFFRISYRESSEGSRTHHTAKAISYAAQGVM